MKFCAYMAICLSLPLVLLAEDEKTDAAETAPKADASSAEDVSDPGFERFKKVLIAHPIQRVPAFELPCERIPVSRYLAGNRVGQGAYRPSSGVVVARIAEDDCAHVLAQLGLEIGDMRAEGTFAHTGIAREQKRAWRILVSQPIPNLFDEPLPADDGTAEQFSRSEAGDFRLKRDSDVFHVMRGQGSLVSLQRGEELIHLALEPRVEGAWVQVQPLPPVMHV